MGLSPKICMDKAKISLPRGEGGVIGILSPSPCRMLRTAGRIKYFSFKNGSGGEPNLKVLIVRLKRVKRIRKFFSDFRNLNSVFFI